MTCCLQSICCTSRHLELAQDEAVLTTKQSITGIVARLPMTTLGLDLRYIIQVRSCSVIADFAGKIFVKYSVLFNISMFFPECVARVPVSLWGLGVGVFARRCQTVRNRPQPFATVRVRAIYGLAYSKFM